MWRNEIHAVEEFAVITPRVPLAMAEARDLPSSA